MHNHWTNFMKQVRKAGARNRSWLNRPGPKINLMSYHSKKALEFSLLLVFQTFDNQTFSNFCLKTKTFFIFLSFFYNMLQGSVTIL